MQGFRRKLLYCQPFSAESLYTGEAHKASKGTVSIEAKGMAMTQQMTAFLLLNFKVRTCTSIVVLVLL